MKTLITAALLLTTAMSGSCEDVAAIKVVEQASGRESKEIGAIEAKDDATRTEILKLWKEAKRVFPKDRRNLFGPDSGFVAIAITDGKNEIVVRSWHPLFEHNPKVVVTSNGVEALEGRDREDILKADKAWYREARRVFDKIVGYTKDKAEKAGAQNP